MADTPPLVEGTRILNDRYRLVACVSRADPMAGLPAVWRVSDGVSLPFAKIWRDDPTFPEVRAIWAHEIRSLLRLGGLPAADEVFVRLREIGKDPCGFVVVLDSEGRELLSSVLDVRSQHRWLTEIKSARVRRRLWQGLLKVARGLAMMHAEGTLHRMLGPESVFTDLEGLCDFRLSGFEWSLRVAPAASTGGSDEGAPMAAPELASPAAQYSVASDWFAFGVLCARVIAGVAPLGGVQASLPAIGKALGGAGLSPAERRLLMDLIDPDPDRRMWHASDVTNAIEEVIESSLSDRQGIERPLYVAFDLGRDSQLTKRIARVAGDETVPDAAARLAFIANDLGPEPQVSARLQPFPHYVLHGRQIDYQLIKWGFGPAPSWQLASCIRPDGYQTTPAARTYRFHKQRIEPRLTAWIAENQQSARMQGERWDVAFPIEADGRALSESQAKTIRLLHMTNQLEGLLAVTLMWPVNVVGAARIGEQPFVDVTPVPDAERDELARLLGVPTPAEQMRRIFQDDDVVGQRSAEQQFVFADEGRLMRRDQNLSPPYLFATHTSHPDGPRYRFFPTDLKDSRPSGTVYLRPRDLAASSVLLHRRKKAIDDLCAHRMVLDAIDDPVAAVRTTVDAPPENDATKALDPSKRQAFAEIWRSQPLYMVQGPPGTGKTTLVATLAAEQVGSLDAAQVLITAQSHTVVDNVADEVMDALTDEAARMAVRLDADKDAVRRKDLGRQPVALRLAQELTSSDLAQAAPGHIGARLAMLHLDQGPEGTAERRDFERLVENGASVTFGTSNSGELASLLESGRRYDWSIVEEAGRAHGFDLALPLQASHRILMIGDHLQLAPFNVEAIEALLGQPNHLKSALGFGSRFAPSLIERHSLKQMSDEPERFELDCAEWSRSLRLFETVFRRCRSTAGGEGAGIARQLMHQHRMHPDIRSIVSSCFYPNLTEADSALTRFARVPDAFEVVEGGWLTSERVVFVDLPYLQRGRDARGEEARPRYTNPLEVDIVLKVLEQLQASKTPGPEGDPPATPSIQVLSPYRAQVKEIRRAVRRAQADGGLPGLEAFEVRGTEGGDVGATVDEFQGNQADVIVVSLVRNNHEKTGKGVGFLKDGSRWNVLLSRAKRKLVLVGSWDFLCSRYPKGDIPDDDPMADLAKVMTTLQAAIANAKARRIPFEDVPATSRKRHRGPRRRSRRSSK